MAKAVKTNDPLHGLPGERYELDPDDSLPREVVRFWAKEKYERVRRYVDISCAVRRKFIGDRKGGATFIDLFCGPGRVRIEDTEEVVPGSPVLAWNESVRGESPFSGVYIADLQNSLVDAAAARLTAAGAPLVRDCGRAVETVERVVAALGPFGLHFAFLDPFNLRALPFAVLDRLSTLERMDILVHVSIQDLQRNLRRYIKATPSPFDDFAPGWRQHVNVEQHDDLVRGQIMHHWISLLANCGMTTARSFERVEGEKRQPLYWLGFAARHERAVEFWEKICALDKQGELF